MAVLDTAQRWDSSACTTRSSSSGIGLTARRVRRMLELAIWMYHIGNPDPVVRVITDVATSLVILWGVVNHYAKKESDKEFMDVYNEMRNWKAVAHYNAEQAQELRERLNEKWEDLRK